MQKPRVNVHVTEEVWERLNKVTDRPDVSKASIVDAALAAFLSPEADDKRDAAIIRRLDKIDRRLEKLEEQNVVISEAIRLWLITPVTTRPASRMRKEMPRARWRITASSTSCVCWAGSSVTA